MKTEDVLDALEKRKIDAYYVKDRKAALEKLTGLIPDGGTVGIGGSVTIQEIGAADALKKKGCRVIWHWLCPPEEMITVRKEATRASVYLSGTNALTYDGRLVNIDGIGNRVSAMVYGPETVIVVAGINKLVPGLDEALDRIKRVACPLNAKRLNLDLPCSRSGECIDCRHDARVCNITTIIEGKPLFTDLKVILAGEKLGF